MKTYTYDKCQTISQTLDLSTNEIAAALGIDSPLVADVRKTQNQDLSLKQRWEVFVRSGGEIEAMRLSLMLILENAASKEDVEKVLSWSTITRGKVHGAAIRKLIEEYL